MTPRQLAVEQLLSRKLYAVPSQQASVSRPQAEDALSPVTPQPPRHLAGTATGQDEELRDGAQSEAESGGIQVSDSYQGKAHR